MSEDAGTGWIALGAGAVAAALAFSSCAGGAGTVCPAIGWVNTVTVGLADDWPPVEGGSLLVECPSPCAIQPHARDTTAETDQVSMPLTGRSVVVDVGMTSPDSVVLTVLGPDGAELSVTEADLDWRRVGGSEECGGPHAVSVVLAAP
jgi:hypothetical protein